MKMIIVHGKKIMKKPNQGKFVYDDIAWKTENN